MEKLVGEIAILVGSLWLSAAFSGALFSTALAASPSSAPSVVAEVDGEKITAEQLDNGLAADLKRLQDQIYNLKRQRLDAMINERLATKEAARLKLSLSELLEKEVNSKVAPVTEEEIDAFYQANKANLKEGPQVHQQIGEYLQIEKRKADQEKYLAALRAKAKIVVNLKPPAPLRLAVSTVGAPFKGGEKAPVTIVKFEDFQCPFCRQAQPTFAQLESRYGNKLKVVHRDFPIDNIHPLARRASEAAHCANEQGKFWLYHDKLYATNLSVDPNQLSALAKETGLDVAAFDRCLSSGQFKAAVQKDFEQGKQLGVTATPAFFINGRLIVGSQSLENFARIIDEELTDGLASKTH